MKSTARISFQIRCWVGAALIFSTASGAFAERIAPCKNPPGEKVTCEDNQLASCTVERDGRVIGSCKTPPKNLSSGKLNAWALSQLLNKQITVNDLTKREYVNMLKSDTVEIDGKTIKINTVEIDGKTIMFNIPPPTLLGVD